MTDNLATITELGIHRVIGQLPGERKICASLHLWIMSIEALLNNGMEKILFCGMTGRPEPGSLSLFIRLDWAHPRGEHA